MDRSLGFNTVAYKGYIKTKHTFVRKHQTQLKHKIKNTIDGYFIFNPHCKPVVHEGLIKAKHKSPDHKSKSDSLFMLQITFELEEDLLTNNGAE